MGTRVSDGGEQSILPRAMAGFPRVMAGLPRVVAGLPRVVAGRPRVMAGLPRVVAGRPRVVAGRPRVMAGFPRVRAGLVPANCPTTGAAQLAGTRPAMTWMGSSVPRECVCLASAILMLMRLDPAIHPAPRGTPNKVAPLGSGRRWVRTQDARALCAPRAFRAARFAAHGSPCCRVSAPPESPRCG